MSDCQSSRYPKREWIPAAASFASQENALLLMTDNLCEQLSQNPVARPKRLNLIGIGASHAAAATPAFRMRADGLDVSRFLPAELPGGHVAGDAFAILISQSGRSAEVVDIAGKIAADSRYAITNYAPSPLGDICQGGLALGNLDDSSVSFVTFTGTILALGLLADHWAGRSEPERWKDAISSSMSAVMAIDEDLKKIASLLAQLPCVDFVAPAPVVSVAEEAALMFREGPRIMATGMETRQYLHGPMDAAGKAAHIVFGGAREALLIDQLSEQSQNLVYVTGSGSGRPQADTLLTVELPVMLDDSLRFAIGASFVAQRLTLLTAVARGIDINEAIFKRLDTKTDRKGA